MGRFEGFALFTGNCRALRKLPDFHPACGKEVVIMRRKRSLKHRYLRFLRRIWPAPTLAALTLSLGACASQPVTSTTARTTQATAVAPPLPSEHNELRYEWDPQLLPTELHLAPEFRSACAPVISLPPSIVLERDEDVVDALEPIASCLTLGPLANQRLHLFGSSDVQGRWEAPVEGGGRADQLRSSLFFTGVPFENLVTHDVANGSHVELGLGPGAS
jgi:hypothetical protein